MRILDVPPRLARSPDNGTPTPTQAQDRLVLIAGTDPTEDVSGHRTYVRAHAQAAAAAGFSPDVFCVDRRSRIQMTDFGVLHRVASPVLPRHTLLAEAHQPFLAHAVMKFVAANPGRYVIHSFGAWARTGTNVSRGLARRGITAVPIVSVYTTLAHESEAKVGGLRVDHGLRKALGYRTVDLWIRAVATPSERRGYTASRLVLVNYEFVRDLVRGLCGPELDIRRLPYAAPAAFGVADTDERGPIPDAIARLRPAGAPLIVSVSRHDPRKGIDVLLRALAALRAAGVPYRACLVGPGPLLAADRDLAASLGLSETVAIPGHVPDVFAYLRQADVFVLPSLQEGSGSISLLEALQMGTAVIASDCDGIPEDVVGERDALLVPPRDAGALQAALARLLADAPLRVRLGQRGRQIYEQRFSARTLVSALTATYAELGLEPS
jgi:glycosyltransferase involved in cell wall biosynthesis